VLSKSDVRAWIERIGVVPVIRGSDAGLVRRAVDAVIAGGLTVIEITFTVPRAAEVIASLVSDLGESALVGAGTVTNLALCREALGAGAAFIVSPNTGEEVIRECNGAGVLVCPGALSPTEVVRALELGADVVKVFPVSNVGGPAYIKALRGPLPDVPFIPTGGIDLGNAGDYIRAGAAAIGVGGSLVGKAAVAEGDWAAVTDNARRFVAEVAAARGGRLA